MNFKRQSTIVKVLTTTLSMLNPLPIEHGYRVAYIATKMYEEGEFSKDIDLINLIILSLFHDVGAYKTEEVSNIERFEFDNPWLHSIYGYLFLKNLIGLEDTASGILYHHVPYSVMPKIKSSQIDYAQIIKLADAVDAYQSINNAKNYNEIFYLVDNSEYNSNFLKILIDANNKENLVDNIADNKHKEYVENILSKMYIDNRKAESFARMLAFCIDFNSLQTFTHAANISAISVKIAKIMNMNEEEIQNIYWGSLLHDIGKICIPKEILENEGKLTQEQMQIMRTHVDITKQIICDCVNDEICKIACNHHEREDGSGYPKRLKGSQLSLSEKIVIIADIFTALAADRSYKKAFNSQEIINILQDMVINNKIDENVVNIVIENFDEVLVAMKSVNDPVLHIYMNMTKGYEDIKRLINKSNNLEDKLIMVEYIANG